MTVHVHRYVLEGSAPATDGACECGAERAFNGGLTALSVTFAGRKSTPAEVRASVARGGRKGGRATAKNWSRGE